MIDEIMELLKLKNYKEAEKMINNVAAHCKDRDVLSALLVIKMCLMEGWYDKLNTIIKKYYM